jgi:hypothetical protein
LTEKKLTPTRRQRAALAVQRDHGVETRGWLHAREREARKALAKLGSSIAARFRGRKKDVDDDSPVVNYVVQYMGANRAERRGRLLQQRRVTLAHDLEQYDEVREQLTAALLVPDDPDDLEGSRANKASARRGLTQLRLARAAAKRQARSNPIVGRPGSQVPYTKPEVTP